MVTFMPGNSWTLTCWLTRAYNVIFCCNMLIYFDDTARSRAMKALDRLLTPEGLLFVGYAETGLFRASGYVPVRYPRGFCVPEGRARQDQPLPPKYCLPQFHPHPNHPPPRARAGRGARDRRRIYGARCGIGRAVQARRCPGASTRDREATRRSGELEAAHVVRDNACVRTAPVHRPMSSWD